MINDYSFDENQPINFAVVREEAIWVVKVLTENDEVLMTQAANLLDTSPQAIVIYGDGSERFLAFLEEEIFFMETEGISDTVSDPAISVHASEEEVKHYVDQVLKSKYEYSHTIYWEIT